MIHAWCKCWHDEYWHRSGPCTWIWEEYHGDDDVRIRGCMCHEFDLGELMVVPPREDKPNRATAMTSPNTLARFGIAPDLYRAGHPWFCRPCNVRLQNGLSGAREHYEQVHVGGITPDLYVVQ